MTAVPEPRPSSAPERTESSYTVEQVLALPVTVDLMTTARVLAISRTTAYELVRTGRFPVRLYRVGTRYRCLRSTLLEYLGIADPLEQKELGRRLG